MQAFITDHEGALGELYGENVENSRKFDACLNVMATRIATVFASLKVRILHKKCNSCGNFNIFLSGRSIYKLSP